MKKDITMTDIHPVPDVPPHLTPARATEGADVRRIYLARGLLAIIWAVGFATVSASLTLGTAVLLVLYPLIDVVATLVDSRVEHSAAERKVLGFGIVTSALASIGLAIVGTDDIVDVLRVFGVWATVSGVTQVVTAARRRGPETGGQWPMLTAGALSTLVGVSYNISATDDNPRLTNIVAYAAAGGAFFVIQAGVLTWRSRRTARRYSVAQP